MPVFCYQGGTKGHVPKELRVRGVGEGPEWKSVLWECKLLVTMKQLPGFPLV